MNRFQFLLDRTAVLFLGIAAGTAIGFAFGHGGNRREVVALAPEAAPVVGGGGGGRDDMAQAGGREPAKIDDALGAARAMIEEKLG